MGNRLIERAVQTARFAFVFIQFACFFRGANQLVQSLGIGRVVIQKVSRFFGILEQAISPLFGLMMLPLLLVVGIFHRFQLCLKRVRFDAAHHFANKLHLTPARLVLFIRNGSVKFQGFAQFVFREHNFFKLLVRQRSELLAERLKRQHFTFFCTFRRSLKELVVDQFVILKGAFVIHVREV